MDDDISLVPLVPVGFFEYSVDCQKIDWAPVAVMERKLAKPHYRLPDLSPLCGEKSFADIYIGWSSEGIAIHTHVREPFRRSVYPDVSRGDSIEVMFDARDLKTSGYNTRFCHHFFAFGAALEGRQAGELTHFRSEEESHPPCEEGSLLVKSACHQDTYSVTLQIPAHCLVGYDPASLDRIGFTYRINRVGGATQHFAAVSQEFQVEQQPSLWGSLRLIP